MQNAKCLIKVWMHKFQKDFHSSFSEMFIIMSDEFASVSTFKIGKLEACLI